MSEDSPIEILSIAQMATRLGVPARWLREHVEAGRVPAMRAESRWLVEPATVTAALARMAANGEAAQAPTGGGQP